MSSTVLGESRGPIRGRLGPGRIDLHRLTSRFGRKPALFLALVLLTFALALPPTRPASAINCGIGCYPGVNVIYYTDATRKHILCINSCGDDGCNGQTSKWFRVSQTCCCT